MTDNVINVTTLKELHDALAKASGGEIINLASGDYGDLFLSDGKTPFNVNFPSEVTIRSADPDALASFSSVDLRSISNLTFDNIHFKSDYTGEHTYSKFFLVQGSHDVTIKNSIFEGQIATSGDAGVIGYATGYALTIGGSANITVENNEFTTWHKGVIVGNSSDVSIIGNDVHSISGDGMNFSAVSSVLIEDNHIHDFRVSPETTTHPDMIQFWTRGSTVPSTDITIRENILDVGDGNHTQSIFMRNDMVDRGLAGEEMFYQNILIENNTILNGHSHGITVGETNGLIVRSNSVLSLPSSHEELSLIPKINLASSSTNVVVEQNATRAITGFNGQIDWQLINNAFIQNDNINAPGYYGDQFVLSSMFTGSVKDYTVKEGSMLDRLLAGSERLLENGVSENRHVQFDVLSAPASEAGLFFDASYTSLPGGLQNGEFFWDFGDGNIAKGLKVFHEYETPGFYNVRLTALTSDGIMYQESAQVGIAGSTIVSFSPESGAFFSHLYGTEDAIEGSNSASVLTESKYVIDLGDTGTQVAIAKEDVARFFSTDSFEMNLRLKAEKPHESVGEIARVHGSFLLRTDAKGALDLSLWLDTGMVNLKTQGVVINDGTARDISIKFDGNARTLQIFVDGNLAAEQAASGNVSPIGSAGLVFGNPWGKQNFDGELSGFSLSSDSKDFPVYDGTNDVIFDSSTPTPAPAPTEEDNTSASPPNSAEPVELDESGTLTPPETGETTTDTSTEDDAQPDEGTGIQLPLLKDGYVLDFATIATSDTIKLHDNAHVIDAPNGLALSFDGKRDFVELGRLTEFEASQKIAFSVDFTSEKATNRAERLVWNHEKIGVSLEGDGVRVHVGNTSSKFDEGFLVTGLGLNDGNQHSAIVMVDAETDRLQIIVDDVLVLDKEDVDFDFVGAGGHEWGWSLGTSWNRWFEGEVHEFQVSDDFAFIEPVTEGGSLL